MRDFVAKAEKRIRAALGKEPKWPSVYKFELDPAEAARIAEEIPGDVAKTFFSHDGRVVHKWTHYLEHYDRHFAEYQGGPVTMLEIGVFMGGSLEMWRKFFGPDATIYGVDIDPACAGYVNEPNQVRIGSQADPAFLKSVVEEMGAPDIILDDGSHVAGHQRASFETLFPLLKDGGLYVIEDIHTSYWPGFYQGGHGRRGTAIEMAKSLIDDMHGWYHFTKMKSSARDEIAGIHFYDSMVFIEKRSRGRPRSIKVGGELKNFVPAE